MASFDFSVAGVAQKVCVTGSDDRFEIHSVVGGESVPFRIDGDPVFVGGSAGSCVIVEIAGDYRVEYSDTLCDSSPEFSVVATGDSTASVPVGVDCDGNPAAMVFDACAADLLGQILAAITDEGDQTQAAIAALIATIDDGITGSFVLDGQPIDVNVLSSPVSSSTQTVELDAATLAALENTTVTVDGQPISVSVVGAVEVNGTVTAQIDAASVAAIAQAIAGETLTIDDADIIDAIEASDDVLERVETVDCAGEPALNTVDNSSKKSTRYYVSECYLMSVRVTECDGVITSAIVIEDNSEVHTSGQDITATISAFVEADPVITNVGPLEKSMVIPVNNNSGNIVLRDIVVSDGSDYTVDWGDYSPVETFASGTTEILHQYNVFESPNTNDTFTGLIKITVESCPDYTITLPEQWIERTTALTASDAGANDQFGRSTSLSADGTVLAVGALLWDEVGTDQGAVYVYDWDGSNWIERTTALTASDASPGYRFGVSTSLSSDGNVLAVGSYLWDGAFANPGSVYVYDWDGANWVERTTALTASDAGVSDQFGVSTSLSADGTVLAVGAYLWDGVSADQGAVYVYDWDGANWIERTTALTASDAGANDQFGVSVSLSADATVLAVGAYLWDGVSADQGAVYVYDWDGANWIERTTALTASDAGVGDRFGVSTSLSADATVLAVGAYLWGGTYTRQGAAYLYDWDGVNWIERTTALTASDAGADDRFGITTSLSAGGTVLAVGSYLWDGVSTDQGSVYIYDLQQSITRG